MLILVLGAGCQRVQHFRLRALSPPRTAYSSRNGWPLCQRQWTAAVCRSCPELIGAGDHPFWSVRVMRGDGLGQGLQRWTAACRSGARVAGATIRLKTNPLRVVRCALLVEQNRMHRFRQPRIITPCTVAVCFAAGQHDARRVNRRIYCVCVTFSYAPNVVRPLLNSGPHSRLPRQS